MADGHTPLYEASYHGKLAIARLLLEHGAAVDLLTARGRHILELRGNPHQESIKELMKELKDGNLLGWKKAKKAEL